MDDATASRNAELPANETEDDRRQKAAEVNRKRAEEQWNRNKRQWIDENFPEKKKPS
jgi:hypothetical protein